jgi:threonine dehydrogenase-like Zn-dependent dehydrogenase
MKTKAVRLYGKNDVRLEEFDLPDMKEDEILVRVISDSICMSSYKAIKMGKEHKRVPADIDQHPVIIGHEFCGKIIQVGNKWQYSFKEGDKFSIQPALNYKGSLFAPGYSYRSMGGAATNIIIPNEVMECGCLLKYKGPGFFPASLSEPMSCIIGAFNANYHVEPGTYHHQMGIKQGGSIALLAAAGPMGLGAIDYAIVKKPGLIVVTDIDANRLNRVKKIHPPIKARKHGVKLVYLNTSKLNKPEHRLLNISGGRGFDDVFIFAPVKQLVEQANRILARDGCLNFFAGPTDPGFTAQINLFNVHYNSTHIVGTSGGNTQDMKDALQLMEKCIIMPAAMISHIGGLDAVIPTTCHLPELVGGKKLIYTNIKMELTALADFKKKANKDNMFGELARIIEKTSGVWNIEAEEYLLAHAEKI